MILTIIAISKVQITVRYGDNNNELLLFLIISLHTFVFLHKIFSLPFFFCFFLFVLTHYCSSSQFLLQWNGVESSQVKSRLAVGIVIIIIVFITFITHQFDLYTTADRALDYECNSLRVSLNYPLPGTVVCLNLCEDWNKNKNRSAKETKRLLWWRGHKCTFNEFLPLNYCIDEVIKIKGEILYENKKQIATIRRMQKVCKSGKLN